MISEILYYIFVFPLECILGFGLEGIFSIVKSYGLSIIILSLLVNIFLLKIFILTDKKAEFESNRKKQLDLRIKAWKSVYKKAKLFAFTQTLYKQNHYHPIYALSALGGLLVQIPFFYAMYFVVKNAQLSNVSFLWISDLSTPDAIFGIHLLPILMTIISLINVWIVANQKGARIQGIIIALIFLVLLYQMPSALVLYWTSNMAFSLIRAVVGKSGRVGSQRKLKSIKSPYITTTQLSNKSKIFKEKFDNFFILRKPLKSSVILLTLLLVFLLSATFILKLSTPYTAKLLFETEGEAKIDYTINALLRSKSMSDDVKIIRIDWDSSIDSKEIKVVSNAQRTINFYSTKPLELIQGTYLGQVHFTLDLSPLFKNLFRYYFIILGTILGIYLLICIIWRFQAYSESYAKTYKNISLYSILCITFLICVFTPYQLYNTDITQFDATQTYSTLALLFGAFILLSFIIIYAISFIPKRFSNFVAFILSVILFSGIIYSFVLVGDYGAMDRFILQKAPQSNPKQILEFVIVTILGITLATFTLKKLMRIWQIILLTLFIVSGVNATNIISKRIDSQSLSLQQEVRNDSKQSNELKVKSNKNDMVTQLKAPYEDELFSYSKTHKNIVVIVLDMFSGSHMPHILEQFPYFKEQLDGFTLFPNAISTTNSTIHSIATLIGGEHYSAYNMNKRKPNLAQEIDKAFISTANAFADNDFNVSLMAFVGSKVENINSQTHHQSFAIDAGSWTFLNYYIFNENIFEIIKANTTQNSKYIQTVQLATFGLFKFLPKHLRSGIYNNGFWLLDDTTFNITEAIGNAASFYAFTHILHTTSAKPTFKYFHSMITHLPYGMYFNNDKCEFFSDKSAWNDYPHKAKMNYRNTKSLETAYYQHFDTESCALKYLVYYLESLKNAGVYDNTQIFVVSDHSGNDSIKIPILNVLDEHSRPDSLLLFKDFGAKGVLKIDNRLMANYDIVSIFCTNLKNGCPNVPPNILKNYPKNREIIHTVPTTFILDKHKPNEWLITKAYKVKNNIYDPNNWVDISDSTHGIVNVKQ